MTLELLLLALAAFFAGFVDAVAGGGGLVQLPALLAMYPDTPVASLFGTNKGASVWGTAAAAARYARRVRLPWHCLAGALPAALLGAWWGARAVSLVSTPWLRPAILVALVAVGVYTLQRRDLGLRQAPRWTGRREALAGAGVGAALGFYDGIFGPGTGAFLVFVLVRGFGYDFLHAAAGAKLINVATNVAALTFFVGAGQILWPVSLVMAGTNVAGALLGSRAALRGGAPFVRVVFLGVVAALVLKMAVDCWLA